MKSFVVWNNKGGVGKSTIVFNISSRYAQLHPEQNVLVVDLCPQANSTMMLLGGGVSGEENLIKLQADSNTIVGYIQNRIQSLSAGITSGANTYHLRVNEYNDNLPKNLWLISGDGNLELVAPAINYYANALIPESAWLNVHNWVKSVITDITSNSDEWVVFIDTNPSFAIHTELAIVAATHLIVPFKADDSSRIATKALFDLLYGSNPPHPVYSKYTFARKARDSGINLPLCQLFIGNQFTQYQGSARAFRGMSQAVMTGLYELYRVNPGRYRTPSRAINNVEDFLAEYIYELRDFNSAGVVAAHHGRLLSDLRETTYDVHQERVSLDSRRITTCSNDIDAIVSLL
jgi:cellulose biosynthesis protein BcsQ